MPSTPTDFFAPWEQGPVESWLEFQDAVNELTSRYEGSRLLWRGARDANWGVHSSLSRGMRSVLGRYPTEAELVDAEKRTLELARQDWRFDGIPALEVLAQLQHFGGPTRLLDVTENPLVALWFATEPARVGEDETDARIFAFVTPPSGDVQLNRNWGSRHPHWHDLRTDELRAAAKWGTGLGRRSWRPPAYHPRIGSQSAGFLIDGAPIEAERHGLGRKGPATEETWSVTEMREFASIPLKLTTIREGELPATAAPVFTYRLAWKAKDQIRRQLESRYGYRASSIYSDMFGLADYLRARPDDITPTR
jgi:hypothetical protein